MPVRAFVELVFIVEATEAEYWAEREDDDSDRHMITRMVLTSWAEANLWNDLISADDRATFVAVLSGIDTPDFVLPCSVAMEWVSNVLKAGDVATAIAIADALKKAA